MNNDWGKTAINRHASMAINHGNNRRRAAVVMVRLFLVTKRTPPIFQTLLEEIKLEWGGQSYDNKRHPRNSTLAFAVNRFSSLGWKGLLASDHDKLRDCPPRWIGKVIFSVKNTKFSQPPAQA